MRDGIFPQNVRSGSWPEARVEELKKRAAEGLSASQIAAALNRNGSLPPLTRNAVLGKCDRVGICLRGQERKPRERGATRARSWRGVTRKRANRKASAPEWAKDVMDASGPPTLVSGELPPSEPAPDTAVSFSGIREGECKWVFNDPKSAPPMACGKPTVAKTHDGRELPAIAGSYCARHLRRSLRNLNDDPTRRMKGDG